MASLSDGGGGGKDFSRTICSICFEDLKPTTEHLQAVSICGHVFHELCLQQWFEYIPAGKKSSCPVCKRICSNKSVHRLYFQSTSDPYTQPPLSPSGGSLVSSQELRYDVKMLETKLSVLNVAHERLQQHLEEVIGELRLSKERALQEGALKDQVLKETLRTKRLLQEKVGEVSTLSKEKSQLQDRCLALAKELASLKLVSDVNLDEEQITRLSTLGGGGNNSATVEILHKSLHLRNLKYKELLAQCTQLGRGETLSLKKLEKSEGKIKKLKVRVQELEKALDEKDNGVLRSLRASCVSTVIDLDNGVNQSTISTGVVSKEDGSNSATYELGQLSLPAEKGMNLEGIQRVDDLMDHDSDADFCDFSSEYIAAKHPTKLSSQRKVEIQAARNGWQSFVANAAPTNFAGSDSDIKMDNAFGNDVVLINNHNLAITNLPSLFDSRYGSSAKTKGSEDGTLEPQGGIRYSGKWLKRGFNKLPYEKKGDLIAVGSDGRGGKIKLLRSQNPVSSGKANSLWPKRCKHGSKAGKQPQSILQIDHFFSKKESV